LVSKWSLSFRLPHQNPVYASPLPNTRYMPRPSYSSPFYHPDLLLVVHEVTVGRHKVQCSVLLLYNAEKGSYRSPLQLGIVAHHH
jgi:hypothetical protein